ncbi:hypothetical protein Sjap_026033 [Stephania japonica]|uniref:Uncharacterized protein n=1 Tax=Stephania japonica TaxID=461633 RepID=A0AAP0E786_9MAGN
MTGDVSADVDASKDPRTSHNEDGARLDRKRVKVSEWYWVALVRQAGDGGPSRAGIPITPIANDTWDDALPEDLVRAAYDRLAGTRYTALMHKLKKNRDRLQSRRQELTQATPEQSVDDEAVYLNVAGECSKGRVYGLGSVRRKKRRYGTPGASTSQTPDVVRGQRVEDVETDCKAHKVIVKGKQADPLKVLERVQKKSHRQVELLSPIPKPPSPEEEKKAEEEKPKPEEKKEEVMID